MSRKPNIVLFISDQQRADTLPGISQVDVHSPHLCRLMDRSAVFSHAFCASPLCTPARASILTGLYPHTHGAYANYKLPTTLSLPEDVKSIADFLKPEGYTSAYVGKWHLPTGNDRRGFSDFVVRLGHHDVDSVEFDTAAQFSKRLGWKIGGNYPEHTGPGVAGMDGRSTKLPLAFHHSMLTVQQAAHFVRNMQSRDDPFLLVYSCVEPHPMGRNYYTVPCPFDRMYRPEDMPLPKTRRDPGAPLILKDRNYGGLFPTDDYTDEQLQELVAGYYGAVSYVDHLLGILLEALISTDQLDDTLLIFTSDHGEMLGDHRMLKKGPIMFEEMIRIPIIIKPPKSGDTAASSGSVDKRTISSLASHVDLLPTILSYAGVDIPGHLQGLSLRNAVETGKPQDRDGLAIEYHSHVWGEPLLPLRSWRTDRWKYVETIDGDDELYDLQNDPGEIHNLVAGGTGEAPVLKDTLHRWMDETGDPWPDLPRAEEKHPMKIGVWDRLASEGPP